MCRLIGIGISKYRHFLKESARIGIGSSLKNQHRQNFADTLPIPFNNLTIINCLSWFKNAGVNPRKSVVPPRPGRIRGTPKMGGNEGFKIMTTAS